MRAETIAPPAERVRGDHDPVGGHGAYLDLESCTGAWNCVCEQHPILPFNDPTVEVAMLLFLGAAPTCTEGAGVDCATIDGKEWDGRVVAASAPM